MIVIGAPSVLLLPCVLALFFVAYWRVTAGFVRMCERPVVRNWQLRQRPVWRSGSSVVKDVEIVRFHISKKCTNGLVRVEAERVDRWVSVPVYLFDIKSSR